LAHPKIKIKSPNNLWWR